MKYLNSLKSLSLTKTESVFDLLATSENLHHSVETLKLNSIKSEAIAPTLAMFVNLKQLRLANLKSKELVSQY